MKKKYLLTICITLALGVIYTPIAANAKSLPQPISIEQDSKAITTNNISFDTISSDKAPEALLKKIEIYKNKEGFVCFMDHNSGYLYLAAMRGEKSTGGYGINVNSVEDVEGRINILVEEVNPDKNAILPQVISYPYTIIKSKIPIFNIYVKNSFGKSYSYYDIERGLPPIIGVSWTFGDFKNVYRENNLIFLEVQNINGVSQLFYAENNDEWNNKIKNLKLNNNITVKYTLGTPQKYKDKSAFPLSEILLPVDKSSFTDKNWKELKSHKDIDVNKQWSLSFNRELSKDNINSTNIYITDSNGCIIPTSVSLMENKKSIKIIPLKPYCSGNTYYLFIANNISSSTKTALNGFRMQFQIADEISVE